MRTMIAALIACLALPALARPLTDDPKIAAELERVRTSIAARELDQALNLTRDQARKLLPEVQALARQRAELERKREVAARNVLAALQRADDELARSGKVSDETLAKLQAARQGARPGAEEKQELKDVRGRIRAILTAEQAQLLRHAPSAVFPGPEAGPEGRGGKHGRMAAEGRRPPPPGAPAAVDGEKRGPGKQRAGRALRVLGSAEFEKLLQKRAK